MILSKAMAIPAVCGNCSAVFPSGIRVKLSEAGSITLKGVRAGPCPVCGGMGDIADGTFGVMGDTVRRLADGFPLKDILKLKDIIEAARTRHSDVTTVAAEIADAPGMVTFADWMRDYFTPKSGGDFFGYMSFLLSVIGLIITMQPPTSQAPQPALTEAQVRDITTRAVKDAFAESQRASANAIGIASEERKRSKIGRNDPCPCKSGKKHKQCCL